MQALLVGAFAVQASVHCYVSQEINHFSKSLRVANIINAGFSNLKTQSSHFKTIRSRLEYCSGFVSSHNAP